MPDFLKWAHFIETIAKRVDELIYSAYSLTREEISEIEREVM